MTPYLLWRKDDNTMATPFYEDDDYDDPEHDVCWCGQAPCTHLRPQVTDVFRVAGWDCL